jgi:O-antigen/teichoic acid export membrane protein
VILSIARLYKFLLQKKLLFKSLAVCEIIANLFSFLLIILLLSFDYGFWAYIVGVLIRSMTLSFLYFYQGIGVFIPKFFCKIRIIKAYLAYGRYNMGQSFIVYFNSQLDNLLIGKLIGMEALGIYSLAKNLVIKPLQFINPVISRVLFPLLSNIRDDLDLVSKTFLNYTLVIGFLSCIVYSLMFAFSEEIVRMLYGEIWIESAGILKILSVGLMISSILNPQGSLLMSIGKVKLAFYWNIGLLIINPLIILSLSNYGPTGIAYGVVLYFAIQLFASYSIIIKPSIKTSKIELLTIFFTHFIAFLLNALIIYLVTNSISSDYIRIAVGIMLSLLIVTMVYFVFHGDKVNDFLKLILKWKKER